MPLGFYMDVHVPSAITDGLRQRGIDVLTSQEDGTRYDDDDVLLQRATDLDKLLFSQDKDLLRIAKQWQIDARPFSGLVFAHQHGPSIGQCITDLDLIAECCTKEEVSSQVFFLPLS